MELDGFRMEIEGGLELDGVWGASWIFDGN
jgi:hypothetical protein